MKIFQTFILLSGLVLGASAAEVAVPQSQPALRWERTEAQARIGLVEKTARVEFPFANASDKPITIDAVRSSCGCTTVSLEKKTYAPGETGRIVAVFTPRSHTPAEQTKALSVHVAGEPAPTILTLTAHLEAPLKLDPALVYWRQGETPAPKVIRIRLPEGARVRLEKVSSNDPRFKAALSPAGSQSYTLTVTPADTRERRTAVLKIEGVEDAKDIEGGEKTADRSPLEIPAYAQIKPALPSGPPNRKFFPR